MAARLPLAWFPNRYTATIRRRKVDRWAKSYAERGIQPYFDSWGEAYRWLLANAGKDLEKASKEVERRRKVLMRVLALSPPAGEAG